MFNSFITFLITSVLCILSACDAADVCADLGFINSTLKCSSCSLLSNFDLSFLKEDCEQCCQSTEEESTVKRYAKARLEICTCKFGAYPQIQAFIKSNLPDQYSNLQIRYVHGRDPVIKLIDHSGEVKEVVAIEKWNTDAVDEFLRTHLERENTNYLTSNLI